MIVAWPALVNKIIINDTTWSPTDGLIRDTMRSGKDKKRLASISVPDVFNVVMIFTKDEYNIFDAWYKITTKRGLHDFQFPTIAGTGTSVYEIYTPPAYSQYGRDTVKCTMTWRTV